MLYYGFFFVRLFSIPSLPPNLAHSATVTLEPPSPSADNICLPNAIAAALSSGVSRRETICSPKSNKSLISFDKNLFSHPINPLSTLFGVGHTIQRSLAAFLSASASVLMPESTSFRMILHPDNTIYQDILSLLVAASTQRWLADTLPPNGEKDMVSSWLAPNS